MAAVDANMYSLLQTPYLHIRHWLPSLITKNALYAHKMTTSKTHQKTQLSVEIPPNQRIHPRAWCITVIISNISLLSWIWWCTAIHSPTTEGRLPKVNPRCSAMACWRHHSQLSRGGNKSFTMRDSINGLPALYEREAYDVVSGKDARMAY